MLDYASGWFIETMSGIGYNVKCYASPRAIAICRFFPFGGNGSVKHHPRRDIVVSSKDCAQKSRSGKVVEVRKFSQEFIRNLENEPNLKGALNSLEIKN